MPYDVYSRYHDGASLGRIILACEGLLGREIFYLEKHFYSLATVEAVAFRADHVQMEVRLDRELNSAAGRFEVPPIVTIRYPIKTISRTPRSISLGGSYGVYSHLVHDPESIRDILDVVRNAESGWEVLNTVRGICENTEEDRDAWDRQTHAIGKPLCIATYDPIHFTLQLRNLPHESACLAWNSDRPSVIIMAACRACLPLAPGLIDSLLHSEREHARAHPKAMPAIAPTADELFARNPPLALIFDSEFMGVHITGNLNQFDAIRLLRQITSLCGAEMIESGSGNVPVAAGSGSGTAPAKTDRDIRAALPETAPGGSFSVVASIESVTDGHTVVRRG